MFDTSRPRQLLPLRPISIWAVSAYHLADLALLAAPYFEGRAEIKVIPEHFESAVVDIQRRLEREHCDVLLTAGANSDYLRARLDLPVVAVRAGGYDVMAAMAIARRQSHRVALLLFREIPTEVAQFTAAFGIELDVRAYSTEAQAREVVQNFRDSGIEVVIGAGLAVRLAEEQGLAAVFLYSLNSVRAAMDDALRLGQAQLAEKSQRELVSSIFHHLDDGVVAVDSAGRIIAANPAADMLTGIPIGNAVGQSLETAVPSLNVAGALTETSERASGVYELLGRSVVVDSTPLVQAGRIVGAVFTLHRSASVEKAFRKLRAHSRTSSRSPRYTLAQLEQSSPAMHALIHRCEIIATRTDVTVLISGPSGVGKEMLAQGIHNASKRRAHPFVAINCGALTESLLESELFGYEDGAFTGARRSGKAGLLEAADRGTIFLDEVAELSLPMQTRLLRVLQEREVTRVGGVEAMPIDFRVIAATHRDLPAMVAGGRFREDLFYRISVLRVTVPGLDARPEDVDSLAQKMVRDALHQVGLQRYVDPVLAELPIGLSGHDWPGNVRELQNLAQRISIACLEFSRPTTAKEIAALIDPQVQPGRPSLPEKLSTVRSLEERHHVQAVLDQCGGNQAEAARKLGISRSTLWRKLAGPDAQA